MFSPFLAAALLTARNAIIRRGSTLKAQRKIVVKPDISLYSLRLAIGTLPPKVVQRFQPLADGQSSRETSILSPEERLVHTCPGVKGSSITPLAEREMRGPGWRIAIAHPTSLTNILEESQLRLKTDSTSNVEVIGKSGVLMKLTGMHICAAKGTLTARDPKRRPVCLSKPTHQSLCFLNGLDSICNKRLKLIEHRDLLHKPYRTICYYYRL
jgi:hypothetical protein